MGIPKPSDSEAGDCENRDSENKDSQGRKTHTGTLPQRDPVLRFLGFFFFVDFLGKFKARNFLGYFGVFSFFQVGSEQKRPGAQIGRQNLSQKVPSKRGLWESYSLQGIIGKTHTQNLQILREDTLGATCSAGPFCLLPTKEFDGSAETVNPW